MGEKLIIKGENTKRPRDWKLFLCNDENKIQFTNVLVDVWRKDATASGLKDRKVILICEGKAHEFTSQDGKTTDSREAHELRSDQEETDTRALLYCWKVKQDYQNIRINTPVIFSLLGCILLSSNSQGSPCYLTQEQEIKKVNKHNKCCSQVHPSALYSLDGSTTRILWLRYSECI